MSPRSTASLRGAGTPKGQPRSCSLGEAWLLDHGELSRGSKSLQVFVIVKVEASVQLQSLHRASPLKIVCSAAATTQSKGGFRYVHNSRKRSISVPGHRLGAGQPEYFEKIVFARVVDRGESSVGVRTADGPDKDFQAGTRRQDDEGRILGLHFNVTGHVKPRLTA